MDKILRLIIGLCLVAATSAVGETARADVNRDWANLEEVIRAAVGHPDSIVAADVQREAAISFGVREVERVVESRVWLGLTAEEHARLVSSLIRGRSIREIALTGCTIALAETQNVSPDGSPSELASYFKKEVVEGVIDRRKRALAALKLLSQ